MVIVIVVITSVLVTVVVICAVLLKKHGGKMTTIAVFTTANQTYGLNTHQLQDKGVEEGIYNYPEVDLDNTNEAKQNEAYVTNTDITTERNQAYGTSNDMTITEGNQAYAMNIITEKNAVYKPR